MHKTQFLNRAEAGLELVRVLERLPGVEDRAVVFAMPDGGAQVAAQVAQSLNVALYPLCVRKLGIPGHDKLSMGALAPGGVELLDRKLIEQLGIAEAAVRRVVQREILELQRLEQSGAGDFSKVAGSIAMIVNDGIADSVHDILAAIEFVRSLQPRWLVIASPVIAASSVPRLLDKCDELVCLYEPEMFMTSDYWYGQRTQSKPS